jgi:hypothetical protein
MYSVDITSAKKIGQLLRSSREEQRVNIQHISKQTGLTVSQLIHIENGNLWAFKRELENFKSNSVIYAQALNMDINTLGEVTAIAPESENAILETKTIPAFLIKK